MKKTMTTRKRRTESKATIMETLCRAHRDSVVNKAILDYKDPGATEVTTETMVSLVHLVLLGNPSCPLTPYTSSTTNKPTGRRPEDMRWDPGISPRMLAPKDLVDLPECQGLQDNKVSRVIVDRQGNQAHQVHQARVGYQDHPVRQARMEIQEKMERPA